MNKRASRPEPWFEKAEHDLVMIQRAMVSEGVPWDMITFHAQQVAEKYLKGFLVAPGIDPYGADRTYARPSSRPLLLPGAWS